MADENKCKDTAVPRVRTRNGRVIHDFKPLVGWLRKQQVGYQGLVAGRKKYLKWDLAGKRLGGNRFYEKTENWNLEMETVPQELRPLDKSDKLTPESRTATATE